MVAARGRSLTPPVGGRIRGERLPPGRSTPAGHQGAPLAAQELGRAAEAGPAAAMDRFVWTSGLLEINETLVIQQRGVRVYDGEEKVGRRPPCPADPRAGLGTAWSSALGSRPRPRGPRCTVDGGAGARGTGGGVGGSEPGTAQFRLVGGAPPERLPPTLLRDGWVMDLYWAHPKGFPKEAAGSSPCLRYGLIQ